ncbi:MAG: hypothetical protein AB1768_13630 [Pseudomonadota bacterium]
MLGIFGAKPDHPLADAREARRVFESFVGMAPATALDEAAGWLESIGAEDKFKLEQRFSLISRFDEAVQAHARRAGRDYLTSPRLGRAQEMRLWSSICGFWAQLARAYEDCLDRYAAQEKKGAEEIRAQLPLLTVRLLRAYGTQLKWEQFRYGPLSVEIWRRLGKAYLAAEHGKFSQRRLAPYPTAPGETTAEREYLKALVFHASSMDSLMPLEIELAERLIQHFLGRIALTAEVRPDNVYWVDCAQALPPTRLAKLPQPSPTLRFFNTSTALDEVAALGKVLEGGEVPGDLNLGGQYSPKIVLSVLRHLALYWAARPPTRSSVRHRVKSRLAVIHGLGRIHARLLGRDGGEAEAWIVEDVSLGGMGAQLPLANNDWIRIGALLGLQPEGGDNWLVGVVRRLRRSTESLGAVGIETLSKTPRAVEADLGGMACEAILLDGAAPGETLRVVLPARAFETDMPLEFAVDGRRVSLQPLELLESGMEFDIGRYRAASA